MNEPRIPLLPIIAAMLGLAMFSLMDGVMKAASLAIGAYAAMCWRGLAGTAIMAPIWLWRGQGWPALPVLKVHVLRGVVASVMAVLFFYGIVRLPLAEGIALSFIAPLIALYLAALLLGEKVRSAAIGGSVLALLGVAVIAGGKFNGPADAEAMKGLIATLVSAVLYAWNLVLQRQQALVAKPEEVAFFQTLVQFLFLGLGAWWFAPFPDRSVWWLLIASAALSTGSLMLMSWAYGKAEAQLMVPLEYTAFIWAAIVGWFAFAEPVTVPMLIGVALIVAGCLYATRGSTKAS
ncbi:MAG: DMT family transporter [Novosphingobium sp.]|uniref:DMT family transporter n=1 Tax=Novosphingobium sp. TaxID=1874826 RepID=UPI003B9D03CD